MSNEYFDVADAAKLLGLSHADAMRLIDDGTLPAVRQPHGAWTVPAQAVFDQLAKGVSHGRRQ